MRGTNELPSSPSHGRDDLSTTNTRSARRVALVVNSGSRSAERLGELLPSLAGRPIEVCIAQEPSQVKEMARDVAARSFDRLLVAGGDGTLSMVVEALVPDFPDIELAVLPLGTGNDFARCLGVDSDRLADAAAAALERGATAIDAVRLDLDGRVSYYLNVANGGLGGQVARTVDSTSKELVGSLAYWLAGAAAATRPTAHEVVLELDGKRREETVIGLAIANGRYVGGGFPIAPEARLDDGLLDVTVIPDLPALEMLAAGTRYVLGGDADDSPAELLRARSVVMHSEPGMPFSIDGELATIGEARFEIQKDALKLVTTEAAEALVEPPVLEPAACGAKP